MYENAMSDYLYVGPTFVYENGETEIFRVVSLRGS